VITFAECCCDKVPHHALISRLLAYGLDDTLIQWLQDFLCSRKQRVGIDGFFHYGFQLTVVSHNELFKSNSIPNIINDFPDLCGDDLFTRYV